MALNKIGSQKILGYVPTAAIESGTIGLFDGVVGVALSARTAAELADTSRSNDVNRIGIQTDEIFAVDCTESSTVAKGNHLFLDESLGTLLSGVKLKASGSNTYFAGTAMGAKYTLNSKTVVDICLNQNLSGADIFA